MRLPPPLQWLPAFSESVGRAVGQDVTLRLEPTVNPLVYTLKLSWKEPLGGKIVGGVWNLFEKWAVKNDAATSGGVEVSTTGMRMSVVAKRRNGPSKNETPW
jgi:hypothetical protein